MSSFAFFLDSNLTQMVVTAQQILEGSHDGVFYIGSNVDTVKLQDADLPGITPLYIEIEDSDPGNNAEASWVKLALTSAGLASAIEGERLNIGTTLKGGVINALPIWVRIVNSLSGIASSNELSIAITNAKEYPL